MLRRDLLDPLIRSVLYITEKTNRRQASAIAAHFVDSGTQSMESVKFLMKHLKDLDVKMYLEVQMTTMQLSRYHKWCGSRARISSSAKKRSGSCGNKGEKKDAVPEEKMSSGTTRSGFALWVGGIQ